MTVSETTALTGLPRERPGDSVGLLLGDMGRAQLLGGGIDFGLENGIFQHFQCNCCPQSLTADDIAAEVHTADQPVLGVLVGAR